MNQLSLNVKKFDLFQKILVLDSYLDYPLSNDSIFSLIGWLKSETNEIVRLELIHTMTVLLKSRNNKVIGK
ncbi:MAG: hypothetical protein HeimC3_01590 [Candidatus Heimdallarchaeota archaeon LC_3]|nr:MAG: hypothetical protein HeimC3_01590 [Candidatus Heimdallarchaeota archaeon LC_3]